LMTKSKMDALLNGTLLVDQTSCSAVTDPVQQQVQVLDVGARGRLFVRHPFVATVATAFAEHRPLILKPVHFWLLVTRSVSQHVNQNSKQLETKFLTEEAIKNSQGKKIELQVRRDDFVYNARAKSFSERASKNDWEPVVDDFVDQMKKYTQEDVLPSLVPSFSDLSKTEATALKVTAMDCLQQFFDYSMLTLCGFPKITLTGTVEDWEKLWTAMQKLIRDKCLPEFADQWLNCLDSIMPKIIDTVKVCWEFQKTKSSPNKEDDANATGEEEREPEIDRQFWSSFCKLGGIEGSGGYAWFNGWICAFFPLEKSTLIPYSPTNGYAQEDPSKPNWYGEIYTKDGRVDLSDPSPTAVGIKIDKFSFGLSSAPVRWEYLGEEIPLEFKGGFVGTKVVKDEVLGVDAVTPEIGWFIQKKAL